MLSRRNALIGGMALVGMTAARPAFAQSQNVVLYTSNNVETVQSALGVLKKRQPNLSVQQVTGGTGVLMKRIEAEKANPGGDLFWSGGFGTLGAYAEHFEPYQSPEAANIPAEFRGPSNLWTGTNVHVIVIMVNSSQLGGLKAPTSWADILRDDWKGKIAITDPTKSSASYIQIYGFLKHFGQDSLRKLAKNAIITGSTGQTYKGVGTGEYPAGITMEYAAYDYVAAGQNNISLVYPTEGTFLSPEGATILKSAKNPAAAKAAYDAFLSKDVQETLLKETFRRPSRADIQVSKIVKLPELAAVKPLPLDQLAAAKEYDATIAAWNQAMADAKK
jgi:iron(III) transport system substrate-binding protein